MKELTSMLPSIGNLTVHQSHLCRLECIMNTACGSWSQYQESCTLYPITLSFDTRIRLKCFHVPLFSPYKDSLGSDELFVNETSPLENATSGIERF